MLWHHFHFQLPGAYLRKIAPMASTKIAFYIYYLLIISPGIHVYVYYMVFCKITSRKLFKKYCLGHMGTLGSKTSQWHPGNVPYLPYLRYAPVNNTLLLKTRCFICCYLHVIISLSMAGETGIVCRNVARQRKQQTLCKLFSSLMTCIKYFLIN